MHTGSAGSPWLLSATTPAMPDSRSDEVNASISAAFGTAEGVDGNEVACFLNDPNVPMLQARLNVDGSKVVVSRQQEFDVEKYSAYINFVKNRPGPVESKSMAHDVLVASVGSSPVQSLYLALKNVYSPLLLENKAVPTELQSLIRDLEAGLQICMHRGTSGEDGADASASPVRRGGTNASDFTGIITPADKFEHWSFDSEKLPSFFRVDCFNVSLVPFKASVEVSTTGSLCSLFAFSAFSLCSP